MGAKGKQAINRKINLRLTAPEGETRIYPSRMKFMSEEHLYVLAPLDIPDLSTLVNEQVLIEEEPVGAPGQIYDTTIVDHTTGADDTEDRLLILNRSPQNQERKIARVDVSFPTTVKVEVKQSAGGQVEYKSYEGLATNISAAGMLIILGMSDENDIEHGQTVTTDFKLSMDEPLMFALSAHVARKYRLEFGELSMKYAIAFQFVDISPEVENHLVRYVLTQQVEFGAKDLDVVSTPDYDRINLLQEEIERLRDQLSLSSEQIKKASESRERSDAIIIQITKRLNQQETLLRRRWWHFWDRR